MDTVVRILIVEDLPSDADLAKREITSTLTSCTFEVVETEEEYLAAIERFQPDLIISDYKLPHFDGLTALGLAWDHAPMVPFIILTGSMNEETAVKCMKAGATDYIIKEHIKRLGLAVVSALEQRQIRFKKERAEAEIRKTQALLKESEEKYRSFFENSIDGVLLTSPEGGILKANAEACRIFGYAEQELQELGRNDINDIVDSSDPRLSQALEERKRTGKFKGELTLVRNDGTKFTGDISTALFKDKDGVIKTSMIIRDVTEKKQAEIKLRQSEEGFRDLYDHAPVGYHEFDTEGRITNVNRTDLEMLGYTAEEMIGQPMWKFNVEEEVARERILAKLVGALPPDSNLERTYRRKDGTTFPALCQDRLILDEQGKIRGIRCTIQDITDRKRAEETLRQSEGNARQLAEENAVMAEVGRIIGSTLDIDEVYDNFAEEVKKVIPFDRIVINMIDTEKNTVKNVYIAGTEVIDRDMKATYPLEGSGNGEMVRTGSTVLIQTEDFSEYRERFPRLLSTFEAGFRSMMNVPLFSKGKIIGGLLLRSKKPNAYRDKDVRLAERIASQIAGAIANAQLFAEHERSEKEKATLREQFLQAQKMESIGKLAGGIAHDFNNLLTVIKGYSQLPLTDLKEGDPLRENFNEILNAAERAARLTRQILAFSRRQILDMKVLDLNVILRDVDKMLQRLIGEDIELVTLPAESLGMVKTDAGQIEQVIMNLAVNARDAMPNGGKLTIETANVELDEAYAHQHIAVKPGRHVMFAVSDTGVGMTPEVKDRVFEPFFTTKEKGKGTGLGLSTVYGIVKQSGGNIWVYSEPGQGTTFKIYLPTVDEAVVEETKERPVSGPSRGGETILIVEDDDNVRKLASLILTRQRYRVLGASSGEEAMGICESLKGSVDLVLTDVVMPGMSGKRVIEELRRAQSSFKVLYMSGYTDNAIVHHGVLEAATDFIQKPFTVDGLIRKVREVLNK